MSLIASTDSLLNRRWIWLSCLLFVFLLQTALVLKHEPWLDEWQALQIALQSPDFTGLLENLRYEGHPPLWSMLLRGAGNILPPAWVLSATQLPIALAIQAIVLLRLPFSRLERLLLATSFFILFDFGTLSRSLSLGVLLLLCAFSFRERRTSWIAIALLPMADFLFGVLSIILIALRWREKQLWVPGLMLWFASSLCAAWTVRPAPDMIPAFWLNGIMHDGIVQIARFGALLLPLHVADGALVWNYPPPRPIALPAGMAYFGLGYLLLRRESVSALLFFGFVALTLIFSVAVYPLAIRHISLTALLLILLVARRRERGDERSPLFLGWITVASACGLLVAGLNLVQPFDKADEAARYIEVNRLQNSHWVSFPDSRAQGVSALLGIEFERLERGCTQSFIRWDYRSRISQLRDLEEELDKVAMRQGGYYLLTDFPLPISRMRNPAGYKLLTHIAAGYDGQNFYLYRVRSDLPESGRPVPQCAPKRLPLRLLP